MILHALKSIRSLSLAVGLCISLMGLASTAQAANIEILTRSDGSSTYILYNGKTVQSDVAELKAAIQKAKNVSDTSPNSIPFGNIIFLNGPGGEAPAAAQLAEVIKEAGVDTIVGYGCYSACSLMWLAGDTRYIYEDGIVGFHFAYTSNSRAMQMAKELNGWLGIQDQVAKSTHYYTAMMFKYGIAKPYEFLEGLAIYGSTSTFFEITLENIDIVGGEEWK